MTIILSLDEMNHMEQMCCSSMDEELNLSGPES